LHLLSRRQRQMCLRHRKPTVAAEQTPQKSQRLVETSPTAADGSAPKRPTIAASIYCIRMLDSWAMIAGHASRAVNESR
ncbi:MAG: hypothetical protein K2J87_07925, partial [Muribaculaceae bacterium]|nr:hypothetical protein [Muribaculaceae bacterium]